MTLTEFLLEIRKRAVRLPRPDSAQHALTTLTGLSALPGQEAHIVRRILAGFLNDLGQSFSEAELFALGPIALGSFDRLLEELLSETLSGEQLRDALQPLFIRAVN